MKTKLNADSFVVWYSNRKDKGACIADRMRNPGYLLIELLIAILVMIVFSSIAGKFIGGIASQSHASSQILFTLHMISNCIEQMHMNPKNDALPDNIKLHIVPLPNIISSNTNQVRLDMQKIPFELLNCEYTKNDTKKMNVITGRSIL